MAPSCRADSSGDGGIPSFEHQLSNEALSFSMHHRDGDAEVDVMVAGDDDIPTDINAPLRFRFNFRKLLRFMGPGWLMSLAYLDPGNLESDLQQGSYTGFDILWILWWSTVMGLILQELSARVGVVTGKDLAQNLRNEYPRWLTFVVYANMEIAVIASDIQEVVGSGVAINLLSNGWIPIWVGCVITGLDTFTFLAVHYLGVRYLEALICLLIATMTTCFFVNWAETGTDTDALFRGLALPTLKAYAVTQAVGTIGAVIMPHNLYLHSGLVLSRKIDRENPHRVHEAAWYNFIESGLALLFAFFTNLAIVATNAGNFYNPACAEIDDGPYACLSLGAYDATGPHDASEGQACALPMDGGLGRCGQMGLATEGLALEHGLGKLSLYIWGIGLLAAGQAATMTCTYAGQIIMGGCLEIQLVPWKRIAITRIVALGPSLLVAASTVGDNSLFESINEYLNILQSIQLPFAMFPLLHLASQTRLMGQFKSHPVMVVVTGLCALLVLIANVILVVQAAEEFTTPGITALCLYAVFYFFLCACMLFPSIVGKTAARDALLT